MAKNSLKGQVVSGLVWKFMETACADVVSFVVSVILARMLLPEDFGIISMVNVFVVLANVFVVNGLGTALIQKKDADDMDFSSVFYFNSIFSILIYLLIFCLAPVIADFYKMNEITLVLRVLGLKVPISAVICIQNAYVSRKMQFKRFFYSTLIGTIGSAAIGLVMAYTGFGVWALVAQVLSNSIIASVVLWFTVEWRPKLMCSFKRLCELINYGWKILASSLIKTGYDQLSNLIIGKMYTSADLAFYSRGKKYSELVVTNVDSSISSVLFPAIAKKQNDKAKLKDMTRRSIKVTTYIMMPMLIGLAAVAEPLIIWMLTEKWLPCVPYLRISCLYYALRPIQTANLQAIRAIGRSDITLKLDIIKRGFGIVLLLLLMREGPIGVALAPVGVSIIATLVNIMPNKKLIGYSYKEQFMDMAPYCALSLGMGIVTYILSNILLDMQIYSLVVLISSVIIGIAFYILISILCKIESFYYILDVIKEMLNKRK